MGKHYVFGQNLQDMNSGLHFINIDDDTYGGCAFAMSTDEGKYKSFVLQPDMEKFNENKENTYTFIADGKKLYYYVNGTLVASSGSASASGKWAFTDFLGNSTLNIPYVENFVGEIDYIQISKYNEEYNSKSFINILKYNKNIIILAGSCVIGAAAVVIAGIASVRKIRKKITK